jgi:excisionase family DNA binding protein
MKPGRIFTTGQAAKALHVAARTVSKWFDEGRIKGYRLPGSQDRRIKLHSLLDFMQVNGLPQNELRAMVPAELIDEAIAINAGTAPAEVMQGI